MQVLFQHGMLKANPGTNGGTYPPNRTSSQTRVCIHTIAFLKL
jgi:hypothetical protein